MTLSRNTIRVGIERIPKAPANSCSSSVFTLANTTSGYASEARSYTGAKPLQGPHHGAQKSTITNGFSLTVFSKFSLVRSSVAIAVVSEKSVQCTLDSHVCRPVRAISTNSAGVYPGTCRNGLPAGKTPRALRMRTTSEPICFVDRVQGKIEQSVERDVGDFIVCRADGQFAYQLAVVVDDAEQGITDVVRGADLLDSTARQIYLQRLLGYPTPRYLHVPVAVNAVGEKLSKQTGAPAIGLTSARDQLRRALAFLGQPEAANLREAVRSWNPGLIPARRMVTAPDALE